MREVNLKLKVKDYLNLSGTVRKRFGKEGIIRLINAMKKLELVEVKGGKLTNIPSTLKHIDGNIWEVKSGWLRFYFYVTPEKGIAVLLGFSTKDRQKEVLKQLIKKFRDHFPFL
ncbi:MAG: hypothetical protein GXO00_01030 [Candidatus Diapherotrites archaeon]|nr:hypothetical protein [Candidatus Diapherotrites archaeon]